MKSSEIIFSPDTYVPYKKRVVKTLWVTFSYFFLLFLFKISTNHVSVGSWIRIALTFTGIFVLFFLLSWFNQIKALDSFIIDQEMKTLKIVMRKYDEVFVKGEYVIDRTLFFNMLPVRNNWFARHFNFSLIILYGNKIIYNDVYFFLLPLSKGNSTLYWNVINAVDQIRST